MKTKIISVILIVLLVVNCTQIYAATKDELNKQNSDLDSKISATEDQLDELDGQISSSLKEVQNLTAQISSYEEAISDLDDQINTLNNQITETQNDIDNKQKDMEEKQDLLDKRLVALYESGNTSYLELLLSSVDLSDFLAKYYLISELATYDTELIEGIRVAKQALEDAKIQLENNKTAVETAKAEQVQKQNALASAKREKEAKVATLSAEEKELEESLAEFEAAKKSVQRELEEIARKEAEARKANGQSAPNPNAAPSSFGYIFPVQGLSVSNIRVKTFPSYGGHTGVDVNINVTGKNVVAVKAGTVAISRSTPGTIKHYDSNGNYDGSYGNYGETVTINHHDGTMTLYAHMKPGSRTVSVGQEVKQGQVIGVVGNTGNVLPRPSPSNPSGGTHLHFEVQVLQSNGKFKYANPINYLPK